MDYTSIAKEASSGDGCELAGDAVLRFGQAVSEACLREFRAIAYEELIKAADGWDDESEAHGMRIAARIVSGRSNEAVGKPPEG